MNNRWVTTPPFDQVLMAAQEGKGWAFERLYSQYGRRLAVYFSVRGASEPDELTNDVLFRVFKNLNDFEGDEPAFSGWVFAIARNIAIDAHRAANRQPVVVDAEIPEIGTDAAEIVALENIGLERVMAMLSGLSPAQRDVILLRMIADLSLNEVAIALDRPVTAVKALQRRGLRRLAVKAGQDALAECG